MYNLDTGLYSTQRKVLEEKNVATQAMMTNLSEFHLAEHNFIFVTTLRRQMIHLRREGLCGNQKKRAAVTSWNIHWENEMSDLEHTKCESGTK